MKNTVIDKYEHKQKPLLYEDQYATIFAINTIMDSCHTIIEALDRIVKLEADKPTKLAWESAIEDIKRGEKVGLALYKTGLFSEELGTIFLIAEDHSAIHSAQRYLMRWR